MDSLFGRKKGRPRQGSVTGDLSERSVPYDRLPSSPRAPVPVANTTQGIRSQISAPITNPTLTANGTELNKFSMQRNRAERERLYDQAGMTRPGSPSTSISTSDSHTLYSESMSPSASTSKLQKGGQTRRLRSSEASSTSSPRSQVMSDFGNFPPSTPGQSNATPRPMSGATSRSGNRDSKYAPSMITSDSHQSHLSHFYHRHGDRDEDFQFPRPENDEEIEAMFENVRQARGLGELPGMSIDRKWIMVYSDAQMRWKESKKEEEQVRKQDNNGPQSQQLLPETPEWFIKKFLDRTITADQASGLLVCLRNKEVRCVFDVFFTGLSWSDRCTAGSNTLLSYKGRRYLAKPLHISVGRAARGAKPTFSWSTRWLWD